MSLRSKVILILLGVFIVYGSVEYLIQRAIIFPSFLSLEQNGAREDLLRSINAIDREIYHLNLKCLDWASWDDTYDFMESHSEKYIKSNLKNESLTALGVNAMIFCDTNGHVVWSKILDPDSGREIQLRELPASSLGKDHTLLKLDFTGKPLSDVSLTGIFMTERGPIMVACRPILTSENKGPSRGYVIFGQFLSDKMVENLAHQTQVDFAVFTDHSSIGMIMRKASNQLNESYLFYTAPAYKNKLHIFTIYRDILGKPAFLIRTTIPRNIVQQGFATIKFALFSVLLVCIGVLFIVHFIFNRVILLPLSRLTSHALSIGETGDYSVRLKMQRKDEIGMLAREFDLMVEKIDLQTKELNNLARIDGLTQIANRRRFDEYLDSEWKHMMREQKPLSLIICDVDFFKLFNDSYGHQTGDDCLRAIARLIENNAKRPTDFAARYGGEEFGIILPNTDTEGALHLAENIRAQVQNLKIPHRTSSVNEYVTLSLGISTFIPDETLTCEDMVDLADRALYEAKARGRNCIMLRVPLEGSIDGNKEQYSVFRIQDAE